MPEHNHSPRAVAKAVAVALAFLATLALYAHIQVTGFNAGTNEKDCEGYVILGKRLAAGEPVGRVETVPFKHINHVWVENGRGELLPKYAPGYPFLLGSAFRLSGGNDDAMFMVNPILGFLTLVGAWFLFRLKLGRFTSLVGSFLLCLHPLFEAYSGYPLAHAMECAGLVWGFALLGRWAKRPGFATAAGAGLAMGFAVGARHTAVLYALPMLTVVAWTIARIPEKRRAVFSALAMLAVFSVIPALVALYHWRWFGSPFHSGYFLTGEQQALKGAYAAENIATVVNGLNHDCGLMLLALAAAGIIAAGDRLSRLVAAEWLLVAVAPYLFYYWAPPNTAFTRFFYPVTPLLVMAALAALEKLLRGSGHRRLLTCAFAAVVIASWWPDFAKPFWGQPMSAAGRPHATVGKAIAPHLRDDAVIFLGWPLDTGIGAFRHYETYRIFAFDPGILDQEMKPWVEPWLRTGHDRWNRWPIMTQESRREKLAPLYAELGPAGLRRKQAELTAEYLANSNQVAYLMSYAPDPAPRAGLPNDITFTLEPVTNFDIPGYGQWGLYEARLKTGE